MPPKFLFDIAGIDLNQVLFDSSRIREYNAQRGDMEQLDGIVWVNPETDRIIGFKDIRADEFWVTGHIPGRPLFPGVLMIEAGAQLASFYTKKYVGWKGFIGFGGADEIKFRRQVTPGCRMYILGQKLWERHHRIQCHVQGVVDHVIVFEALITGIQI
jgi:3-hydroxyacyl-[acyl-carrier-protein] dehydratase